MVLHAWPISQYYTILSLNALSIPFPNIQSFMTAEKRSDVIARFNKADDTSIAIANLAYSTISANFRKRYKQTIFTESDNGISDIL